MAESVRTGFAWVASAKMDAAHSPPRLGRQRLRLGEELLLAALPTVTILAVFALLEAVTSQRLLFASLASSAFLIYLDPEHSANQVKTLVVAQIGAAVVGYVALAVFGPGYAAAAAAMVVTIVALVISNLLHPPAVSTALAFAFQESRHVNLVFFALAVGMVAVLLLLERGSLWVLRWSRKRGDAGR